MLVQLMYLVHKITSYTDNKSSIIFFEGKLVIVWNE